LLADSHWSKRARPEDILFGAGDAEDSISAVKTQSQSSINGEEGDKSVILVLRAKEQR
jgi:hypothetical protein